MFKLIALRTLLLLCGYEFLRSSSRKLQLFLGARLFASFGADVVLGAGIRFKNCSGIALGQSSRVAHDVFLGSGNGFKEMLSIGANVYVGPRAYIDATDGGIDVGDHCLIGPNVVIRASNHVFSDYSRTINSQGCIGKGIKIGKDVWLGSNVVVLDGVNIGSGCVIGAGAVVTRDIPPYSIAVGVPAKVIALRGGSEALK